MPNHPDTRPMTSFRHITRLASALAVTAFVAARPAAAQLAITAWDPGTKFAIDASLTEAPQAGCRFGFAVAMTDDIAVIGAPDVKLIDKRFNTGSNGAGAAFVFKRTAGTDTWTFIRRLIAPERSLTQTGCAVAIDPATLDIVVGYGAGSPASYSCDLWMKDFMMHELNRSGIKAYEGKKGGAMSGWSRNNLNQYFRKWERDEEVHTMQLEIVYELRRERDMTHLTADYLAMAMGKLLKTQSWSGNTKWPTY